MKVYVMQAGALIALAFTCHSVFAGDELEVVKIGSAAPTAGAIASLGKENENGARLAVEDVNRQGLVIGGRKIRLVLDAMDDAADPRQGTQIAQKLVDDGVIAVVGHLNSGVSIAASRIYHDAQILQISPDSTNPAFTQQGFNTTYRLVATDSEQAPVLAHYALNTLRAKKVAVVDDSTAYGQGLADQFAATTKAGGATIVAREATNDKAIDFKGLITRLKAENPDAVFYGGMDATAGPFLKQAKGLNLKAKFLGGDGTCSDEIANLAGVAVDNLICTVAGLPLSRIKTGDAFEKAYEQRFGMPVQIYAPYSYDAVMVIVDAMKRTGSTDPKKILAAVPSTDYQGLIGRIQFDSKGDVKNPNLSLYGYKNGKKTLITTMVP
ncbi:branched-chain amino acid ABC transporter substrate-binding protein [Paraburkholderia sp. GAS32]|uniref:branched-chain amino acid ABC transporter substrate-binding protein n=1 Tax=Paraburkholderia sp. GAS32 TaxID=3035129 RepID=UPI003D1BDD6B